MSYTPSSTQYKPDWDKRMAALLAKGMTVRAASVVLFAAIHGIGCVEGEVRLKEEARQKAEKADNLVTNE